MGGRKIAGKREARRGRVGRRFIRLLCAEGFMTAITYNSMLLMGRVLEYAIQNGAKTGLVLLAYTKKKDKIVAKWVSS